MQGECEQEVDRKRVIIKILAHLRKVCFFWFNTINPFNVLSKWACTLTSHPQTVHNPYFNALNASNAASSNSTASVEYAKSSIRNPNVVMVP